MLADDRRGEPRINEFFTFAYKTLPSSDLEDAKALLKGSTIELASSTLFATIPAATPPQLISISLSGMAFNCTNNILAYSMITISIQASTYATIHLIAKVTQTDYKSAGQYYVRVKFIDITPSDQALLRKQVKESLGE